MIQSKVIRDNRRHITRADYTDTKQLLDIENIHFPKVGGLESRALRRLFPAGITLSHREFDFVFNTYRLGRYVDSLRDKGWAIVNHDEAVKTLDKVPRTAIFTRYELFAEFTPELKKRINEFCNAVDQFEADATTKNIAA